MAPFYHYSLFSIIGKDFLSTLPIGVTGRWSKHIICLGSICGGRFSSKNSFTFSGGYYPSNGS